VRYRIGVPETLALLACAFLIGAIPFAYLAVRLVHGTDVRRHGSGNPGATNAARLWPKRWQVPAFLAIFLCDAGKGYVAAGLLPGWLGVGTEALAVAAGLAAVLGHSFSPFLGFRGGKGVATTLGVLAALEPLATAAALAAFFAVYLPTRIVAAGSLALAIVLPVAAFVHDRAPLEVKGLTLVLAVLIITRHRSNIARMLGREGA